MQPLELTYPRSPSPRLLALASACLLALGGCGDESAADENATTTTDRGDGGVVATTLDPNQEPPDLEPGEVPAFCASVKAATAEVVGLSLADAESAAQAAGCSIRVVEEDGEPLPVTQDFSPTRIGVATEDEEIVRVELIG